MNNFLHRLNYCYLSWGVVLLICLPFQTLAQSQDSIRAKELFDLAKAQIYTSPDSSLQNFEQAAKMFEDLGYTENYLFSLNNLIQGYIFEGQVDKASEYAAKLDEVASAYYSDTSVVYAKLLYTPAFLILHKGHLSEAARLFQKCIDIFSSKDNLGLQVATILSYCHQMLSLCYRLQNEYNLAVNHLLRGMKVIEEFYGKEHITTQFESAIAETTLGDLYYKKGELSIAKKHLDKSLNLFTVELKDSGKELPELVSRKGILYLRLADYYENLNADSMLYWANQALELSETTLKQRPVMAYNRIGLAYQSKGMIPEARLAYNNGIKYLEGIISFEDSYTYYGNSLMHLAKLELVEENYEEGMDYAAKLSKYFSSEESPIAKSANPDISTILSYGYTNLYEVAKAKAQAFYQMGEESGNEQQFMNTLLNYDYAIELAKEIRHQKWSEGAKFQGADRDFELYEGAIRTALKLHQLTGEPDYIDVAFNYAEQSKAALLQESIDEKTAKSYGGIPDSLLSVERNLRIDIAFFKKAVAEEKRKPVAEVRQDRIAEWEEKLFEKNSSYYKLIELLEEQFPKYHRLKYQSQYASIQEIQAKALDKESVLLNFFGGESELYVFMLTKTDKSYHIIEDVENLEREVQAYLESIKQPSTQTIQIKTILHQSHSIYEKLLAGPLASISEKKRLIVIPDNWISYLPMETLVTSYDERETDQYDSPSIHYLFEDYTVSYDYSGSLLLKNMSSKPKGTSRKLLGLAPSFRSPIADVERSCSSDELYSLQCSQIEVQQLNDYFSGINFIGDSATTSRFLQTASDYQIIHLATHACIDSENPMLNKIFFADDYLTNYDLYDMQLNAELAVLSACNTGSGQLIKGEGVMSLSKGFIHAGVPSTVTSLWSVDDCATSTIMTKFYKNLKQGLRKDKALQQARVEYLAEADRAFQHPYYWGAFVHVGNPVPISSRNKNRWMMIITLGIGAILLGLAIRRKRVA